MYAGHISTISVGQQLYIDYVLCMPYEYWNGVMLINPTSAIIGPVGPIFIASTG
jgi:hypothetical protein